MQNLIGELYGELRGYLVTLIRNRLFSGCPDDYVYDCLNDVFEIALRKQNDPGFQKNPKGWLIVTAKNVVDNFNLKTVKRLTFYQSDCEMDWIPDECDMLESLSYSLAMENHVLEQIKKDLSEEERLLFVMRYERKMSARDIAEELHLTSANVSTKLTRIKRKVTRLVYAYVS